MRLKRSDKNKQFYVDWLMKDEGNSPYSNDITFYVIFEADPWPASQQTTNFEDISGITPRISFRSNQPYYDKRMTATNNSTILQYGIMDASYNNINNSDIEYNFEIK